MRPGKTRTGMSSYQPPDISFRVFTWEQYNIEFRLHLTLPWLVCMPLV